MKRELKFRAWNHEDGKMEYPLVFASFTSGGNLQPLIKCSDGNRAYKDYPVMQYTGLKDKNGKEIYEGDILKTATDKPMIVGWSEKFASYVLNRNGWAFTHWFGESCNPDDCEIVGNKYENPELLQDVV
jgi:uncharacterized phage protein (TIGR01671 family)